MVQVIEIQQPEDLEPFTLVWNSLLRKTRNASFFQSLDWLKTCWKHFGHEMAAFRTLVVLGDDQPLGIMPLVVENESTRVGNVRVLTYPLRDWGSFFGPVGPHPTATSLAAIRHLQDSRQDWDLADFRWIDPGVDGDRTATAMRSTGMSARQGIWKHVAMIAFPDSWDAYLASRPHKFRNNVRRAEKRVRALGQIEFDRYRPGGITHGDADPNWALFDECVELAQRSWQGSSTTGTTLSHANVAAFFRETHALAARAGMVDISTLRRAGELIAFGYKYHWNGRVIGLRMGYDNAFRHEGVGTALYAQVIRDSIERRDRVFDLGPDYYQAKRRWLTHITPSFRATHYRWSARAQLLRAKRWIKELRGVQEASITAAAG